MFTGARLKIQRAKKHILELNALLEKFSRPDSYSLRIKKDSRGQKDLVIKLLTNLPTNDAALIIGDALHNLRSALDLAYVASAIKPTSRTMLPIRDTREEFVKRIDLALKNGVIRNGVHKLLVDKIKPYRTGNHFLWALHNLDIMDKHQLLLPVFKSITLAGCRFEDEQGQPIMGGTSFHLHGFSAPTVISIFEVGTRNVTIKDKGHLSCEVIFGEGTPLYLSVIVPTLGRIAEEVTRTIKAFARRLR